MIMTRVVGGGKLLFLCEDNFIALQILNTGLCDGIFPNSATFIIDRVRVDTSFVTDKETVFNSKKESF